MKEVAEMGWWDRLLARLFGKSGAQGRPASPDEPRHRSLTAYLTTPAVPETTSRMSAPPPLPFLPPPAAPVVQHQPIWTSDPPSLPLSSAPVSPMPAAPAEYTYALRDDFLSRAEASFFHVLRAAAAADSLIFPKVRLADLVFPPRQEGQFGAWQRINRKHVDFVLCKPCTLRPLVALELDDRSHRRPDRLERDAFVDRVFADAGLPLVHVPARRSYDTRTVAALIDAALAGSANPAPPPAAEAHLAAPRCARCGGEMRLRTAARGPQTGEQFWGCVNYPRCRQTVAVDTGVQHAGRV